MYKLLIHSQKEGEFWLVKETKEECDAYIAECAQTMHWGTPSWTEIIPAYAEVIPEKTLEDGSVVSEEVIYHEEVTIHHEGSYSIEVIDISAEVEKENKLKQIAELEAKITPRRLREAVLSGDNSFIVDIDNQIAAIRSSL